MLMPGGISETIDEVQQNASGESIKVAKDVTKQSPGGEAGGDKGPMEVVPAAGTNRE